MAETNRKNSKSTPIKPTENESAETNPFLLRASEKVLAKAERQVHVLGDGIICDTESRGHATPEGRSPLEIVVDATEGFIPLWAKNTTLRWRFQERSLNLFESPASAKNQIRELLGECLLKWGDAAPVKFSEQNDTWDFEIVVRNANNCSPSGCVLASAFFPDSGRHQLRLYPMMFTQDKKEQIDTLIHEIGHIFGLRHFFAKISETQWASEIFGEHNKFSIMNYGQLSMLTEADKNDLKRLYQMVWSGQLTNINGTPIRLVQPFHTIGSPFLNIAAIGQPPPVLQPQSWAAYAGGI
jgi:hypothetical protein